MRVAVVIDDGSRPTPVAAILPSVLEELHRCGVRPDAITLVTALGVHRPMRPDEIAHRVGTHLLAALRWENHDADDRERLVHLGTTARGTPVWMNRTVAEANLVVSIGCIEPHVMASFSGGYKNLIPGVAGRETIGRNHALNCTPETCNLVGQPIERNPMRLDLEEGGRMLGRPVFIVNVVLDGTLQVARVVSGDPVAAHREGARTCADICGLPIAAPADVVIAASHPMDQDLRQGVKALANTIRALRPGGVQIVLARAREGLGVFGVAHHRVPGASLFSKLLTPRMLQLLPRLNLLGLGEEDRFFAYFALHAMRRNTHLLYAPTVPAAARKRLPFVKFVDAPDALVSCAARSFPNAADVLVFLHAGTTYPVLAER